ncbi:5-formyltetrahydrofolate cyclo-ligase [Canibacter sp. lx-72]|uniref:5-formyltetrahydrofolate cyclo-ligase n=1 Tax=Canibacter zhuwentaonis TaxID=2837491 RepID=UPI001BDD9239|nr:5-formyltetrahydrofolate cyclo-ligase [Canibacter zhuwentaonis]MBT1018364.1 5-formyltetrahydrofolate cyclo-ligase [Canibacter zhuwentaonis]MBT1035552.1 5-formyltetrahydrofolate cyclo-ligase [Canibacter zhuwentaonis]
MNTQDVTQAKQEIRARVRQARGLMSELELKTAKTALTKQLIALVTARGARSVSCYLPVRSEPDTTEFITWARANGVRLLLPSCRKDLLLDWIEPSSTETVPGLFGIPEPVGEFYSPLEVQGVDLMMIPGCAAATDGTRLGWGGGFFDRTIGSMETAPPVFTVLYDNEIFARLPRDVHDAPVTGAVTPSGVKYLDRSPLTSEITVTNQ